MFVAFLHYRDQLSIKLDERDSESLLTNPVPAPDNPSLFTSDWLMFGFQIDLNLTV